MREKEMLDMKQVKKKQEEMGELLMKAFLISLDTADVYAIGKDLEMIINSLDLPKKQCGMCAGEMSFFNWHLSQGYCDRCSEVMSKEQEKEEALI